MIDRERTAGDIPYARCRVVIASSPDDVVVITAIEIEIGGHLPDIPDHIFHPKRTGTLRVGEHRGRMVKIVIAQG